MAMYFWLYTHIKLYTPFTSLSRAHSSPRLSLSHSFTARALLADLGSGGCSSKTVQHLPDQSGYFPARLMRTIGIGPLGPVQPASGLPERFSDHVIVSFTMSREGRDPPKEAL